MHRSSVWRENYSKHTTVDANCSSNLDISFEGEVITHMSRVNVAESELVGSGVGNVDE